MTDKKKKSTDPKTYKFDTLSLHAGYQPHKNAGSRQVPIYQTTSYLFDDVDHAAALFNLERGGHIYSRISNPTVAVLEERVAALEGGTAALATSSGMSAIFLTVMTLCEAGDHLVVSSQLYGGTVNLFRLTLPKFGIKCTFVKPRDTQGFKKAIQKNTKGIFGELVGNPGNELMDMPEVAKIAHAVAKHSVERMSAAMAVNVTTQIADIFTGGKISQTRNTVGRATGMDVLQLGIMNPFGRKQESEADYLGLIFSSLSGYNIKEAVYLWERMKEANKGKEPPQFMSTHPSSDNRIISLKKWIPKVILEYPPLQT